MTVSRRLSLPNQVAVLARRSRTEGRIVVSGGNSTSFDLFASIPEVRRWETKFRAREHRVREHRQQSFFAHAYQSVSAYAAISTAGGRAPALSDFPVLERHIVAQDVRHFVSTAYDPDELVTCTTSGTSGMPLPVHRDEASRYDLYLNTYRLLQDHVDSFAALPEPGACAVLSVTDNPLKTDGGAINSALNNALVLWRTDDLDPAELARWCRRSQDGRLLIPLLVGRPRSIRALLRRDMSVHLDVRAVVCSGENLHSNERAEMADAFGCAVYDAYASRECGFVAAECAHGLGLHVLPGRATVEVRTRDGILTVHGTGELVITSYENWAMPLIRYATGDVATVRSIECRCGYEGTTLTGLTGRETVDFTIAGTDVNPAVLDHIFEEAAVFEYHVRQINASTLAVDYALDANGTTSPRLDDYLRHAVERALPGAAVDIVSGPCGAKRPRYSREPRIGA